MARRRTSSRSLQVPVRANRATEPGTPKSAPSTASSDAKFTGPTLAVGFTLTALILLLYVRTAARSIVVGDNPELITTAVTLGVPHPPGYPLLVLIGHLFSLLPLGPVAFRVNLTAAVCGAGTAALVYLTAWRLTHRWSAAALASAALAVSPLFWSWSLAFEAFCLNNLLAATLIYVLVCWQTRPDRNEYLVAAALVGGLGIANHQTIVLLAPAALALTWRHFLWRPRLVAACAVAVAIGLLPYAYIPWAAVRHPFLSWGEVSSVSDFVHLVTRADYGTGQLISAENFRGGSPLARVLAFSASFAAPQALLLVAGAAELYRSSRQLFWFFLLAFAVAGPAFVGYANMDLSKETALFILERFFLLPHVAIAPLMALGLMWLSRHAARLVGQRLAFAGVVLSAVVALAVPAVKAYARLDQSGNYLAEHYAEDVLDSLPPGSLLLAAADEHCFPLAYVQAIEGRRRDVTLVLPGLLRGEWYIRQLRARFPDLHLRPDSQTGFVTVKSIIEANPGRFVAMVGPTDDGLKGTYGLIWRGLAASPEPLGKAVDFVDLVEKNDTLLRAYRIPNYEHIDRETYELFLLRAYAQPAAWIATQYQQLDRRMDAATWFRRALTIDPQYPGAREGLAQVGGK